MKLIIICVLLIGAGVKNSLSVEEEEFSYQNAKQNNYDIKFLCDELCRNGLGGPLCDVNCGVQNLLSQQMAADEPDSLETDTTIVITTTPSSTTETTPNWFELCQSLCATGDGGLLCNCDLPPFYK